MDPNSIQTPQQLDLLINQLQSSLQLLKQMNLPTSEIENNLKILNIRKKFQAFSSPGAFFNLPMQNFNPSIDEVTQMISSVSQSVFKDYKFEMIGDPQQGRLTGDVSVYRPDGKTDKFSFNKEMGYRAQVKLSTKALGVVYQGYMYYRMACMNPVRQQAISVQANVIFEPLVREGQCSMCKNHREELQLSPYPKGFQSWLCKNCFDCLESSM